MRYEYTLFCQNCGGKSHIHVKQKLETYHCVYCGADTSGVDGNELVHIDENCDIVQLHFIYLDKMLQEMRLIGGESGSFLYDMEMQRIQNRSEEQKEKERVSAIVMELFPDPDGKIIFIRCSECSHFTSGFSIKETDTLYCPICGHLNHDQCALKSFARRMKANHEKQLTKRFGVLGVDAIKEMANKQMDKDILDRQSGQRDMKRWK